jgi:hypothetical protein
MTSNMANRKDISYRKHTISQLGFVEVWVAILTGKVVGVSRELEQ